MKQGAEYYCIVNLGTRRFRIEFDDKRPRLVKVGDGANVDPSESGWTMPDSAPRDILIRPIQIQDFATQRDSSML
jgi:hypothetical protein